MKINLTHASFSVTSLSIRSLFIKFLCLTSLGLTSLSLTFFGLTFLAISCFSFSFSSLEAQIPVQSAAQAPAIPSSPALNTESFPTFSAPSPTFSSFTSSLGGQTISTPSSGTLLQQIYPEPAKAATPDLSSGNLSTSALTPANAQVAASNTLPINPSAQPFVFKPLPVQNVKPAEIITPGFATIKKGIWTVHDFFYNLPAEIGVKVEIVKPTEKYIPLNGLTLETQIKRIFSEANIGADIPITSCQPPLPLYHLLIMTQVYGNRCLGFLTMQLYEAAKPLRIEEDFNGIWQVVTWEKQILVASHVDDFSDQVSQAVEEITKDFTARYQYYHPVLEQPCFNVNH